jgi:Domain of unknown function (DUF6531)
MLTALFIKDMVGFFNKEGNAMFKYLFMLIGLLNSFAIVSAQEFETNSFSEKLQNSNSSSFTNLPYESSDSSESYIEFDDFPDNAFPDFDSIESHFEENSETVFEKKSHDFASIPDVDETIGLQSDFGIDIYGHPSAIVNGCINVVSGEYQESAIDFTLAGAKPLNIQRNYCGGKSKKNSFLYGWQLNHGAKLFSYLSKHDHLYASIKGGNRHGVRYKV